jgi:hypothetical protein
VAMYAKKSHKSDIKVIKNDVVANTSQIRSYIV